MWYNSSEREWTTAVRLGRKRPWVSPFEFKWPNSFWSNELMWEKSAEGQKRRPPGALLRAELAEERSLIWRGVLLTGLFQRTVIDTKIETKNWENNVTLEWSLMKRLETYVFETGSKSMLSSLLEHLMCVMELQAWFWRISSKSSTNARCPQYQYHRVATLKKCL